MTVFIIAAAVLIAVGTFVLAIYAKPAEPTEDEQVLEDW